MNAIDLPKIKPTQIESNRNIRDMFVIKTKWSSYFGEGEANFAEVVTTGQMLNRTIAEIMFLDLMLEDLSTSDILECFNEDMKAIKKIKAYSWFGRDSFSKEFCEWEVEGGQILDIIYFDKDGTSRKSTFTPEMALEHKKYVNSKIAHISRVDVDWEREFMNVINSMTEDFNVVEEKNAIVSNLDKNEGANKKVKIKSGQADKNQKNLKFKV